MIETAGDHTGSHTKVGLIKVLNGIIGNYLCQIVNNFENHLI